LANHKSALKRVRTSAKRRLRNRIVTGRVRASLKRARTFIAQKDVDAATDAVQVAIRELDRAAEKGMLHKNNAARRKSRLMRALNQIKAT